jgi:hypothetical protein
MKANVRKTQTFIQKNNKNTHKKKKKKQTNKQTNKTANNYNTRG